MPGRSSADLPDPINGWASISYNAAVQGDTAFTYTQTTAATAQAFTDAEMQDGGDSADDGDAALFTVAPTSGKITANAPCTVLVSLSCTADIGANGDRITLTVYKGPSGDTPTATSIAVILGDAAAGEYANGACVGVLTLGQGEEVTVWGTAAANSDAMDVHVFHLSLLEVSRSPRGAL